METDHVKIMNLLPRKMGEDYLLSCKAMGISANRASKLLGELMDKDFVDLVENDFVITEKGKSALEEEVLKSDMAEMQSSVATKSVSKQILWKGQKLNLHPAQSFIDGVAYTYQCLPFQSEESQEVRPVIISSDRRLITLDNLPPNVYLTHPPVMIGQRWTLGSINEFINGKAKIPTWKEVFEDILAHLKYYMDLEEEERYAFVALWSIGTYFFRMFPTYPYLFINAVKRSGKTKLLLLLSTFVFNGKAFIIPSGASIFRLIQGARPTLCLDEIEKVHKRDEGDIRSILLSGYKSGAMVPRTEEKVLVVGGKKMKARVIEEFDVFCPKALANIMGMERTLEDRCLPLIILRSDNKEILNRIVEVEKPKFQRTRDMLYLLMMGRWQDIADNYKMLHEVFAGEHEPPEDIAKLVADVRENVSSRHFELWVPIFALAYTVSVEVFEQIVNYAKVHTKEREQDEYDESYENTIIQAVIGLCEETGWYRLADLSKNLQTFDGLENIKSRTLKRVLRRLRLANRTMKETGRIKIYIDLERVRKIAKRFLIDFDEIRNEFEQPVSSFLPLAKQFEQAVDKLSKESLAGFTKKQLLDVLGGVPKEKVEQMFDQALQLGHIYEPMQGIYKKVGE